jgi:uncharacterized protein (UPF0548 family)
LFLHRRPSSDQVQRFLSNSASSTLSYAPVGIAREAPAGFNVDDASTVVGCGKADFARARDALIAWKHFDLGWLEVFPRPAPLATGTLVAVLVRHVGFWSLNACRIVYLIDEDRGACRKFGFAYGTLRNHAEQGEEIFTVSHRPDTDKVRYEIRAVSRPRAPLARLGYPVTRALQARFRRDSIQAMRQAV